MSKAPAKGAEKPKEAPKDAKAPAPAATPAATPAAAPAKAPAAAKGPSTGQPTPSNKPAKAAAPVAAKKETGKSEKMREIRIAKLVINCCVGESGDKLTKAARVLEDLTKQKPIFSRARFTVRSFGIKRNEKIAAHVTVRGDTAHDILERGLKVKEMELRKKNFSNTGNFGFGIQEHIDLGLKYDPYTGIFGMDFYVVLERPGTRIATRKRATARIGTRQRVSKEEAIEWFKNTFEGTVY